MVVTTWTADPTAVASALSAGSRAVLVQLAFELSDLRILRLDLGITFRERLFEFRDPCLLLLHLFLELLYLGGCLPTGGRRPR